MSRRKQGRPQQRLSLGSVEQENDLLVCGDCQTKFPLREITKFIRHKINKCNKENVSNDVEPADSNGPNNDDDDAETIIGSKLTPISAPITRKESFDGVSKSPRQQTGDTVKQENEVEEEDVKKVDYRLPFRLKQVVDAETSTFNNEPLRSMCATCRKSFSSAWSLVQHAQKDHGLRIYTTSSRDTPNSPRSSPLQPQKSPKSNTDLIRDRDKNHHVRDSLKDREKDDLLKERNRSDSADPLRKTSSVGSASSGEGPPHSGHPSPINNPFMFPRMPFPDVPRHPHSPIAGMGPLRSPADLRIEFDGSPFHPGHVGIPRIFGFQGYDHSPSPTFNPFEPRTRGGMSLDDFYSQRLRQLASSTSPSHGRKQTPPFTQTSNAPNRPSGLFPSLTPPAAPTSDSEKRVEPPRSLTPPGNLKSCEFCGKTFRFQSNLIVHRRSHTGEKPFKCPLCPHACTQQSKLKRHMKTHVNKLEGGLSMGSALSTTSEGSQASSSSTPDSNKMGNDEDEDEDAEDEEEEELEEEEDMELSDLQELREEERRLQEAKDNIEKDGMKNESKSEKHDFSAGLFDRRLQDTITDELSKETNRGENHGSILSEVMENPVLKSIPNYTEALKQAMAEKLPRSPDTERPERSPQNGDKVENDNTSSDKDKRPQGTKRDKPEDESGGIMSISKMIKKEPHEKVSTPPASISNIRVNNNIDASPHFYPSLWFPAAAAAAHPEFYNRFPLSSRFGISDSAIDVPPHNGYSISGNDTALSSNAHTTSCTTPTTPQANSGSSTPTQPRRGDKGRNDTCEYCGKVFRNCSNLTVHRRSHTGEKPYKCMLCSYACAQSSKLTRHMKTHGRLGKDVYKCKFCGMPFSVPSTLEKHMRKCVENTNASVDNDDTGSNSDAASATDGLFSTSLSLQNPFSVPAMAQMRKALENNGSNDGEDTGSNSDAASASENALATSGATAATSSMSLPTTPLSFNTSLGLSSFSVPSSLKKDLMNSRSTGDDEDNGSNRDDTSPTNHAHLSFSSSGSYEKSFKKSMMNNRSSEENNENRDNAFSSERSNSLPSSRSLPASLGLHFKYMNRGLENNNTSVQGENSSNHSAAMNSFASAIESQTSLASSWAGLPDRRSLASISSALGLPSMSRSSQMSLALGMPQHHFSMPGAGIRLESSLPLNLPQNLNRPPSGLNIESNLSASSPSI